MKLPDSPRQTFIADNARTAEFLLNRDNQALMDRFWGREDTVAEVAKVLDLDRNKVLYRVRAMLEMGLLRVARVTPRRGRAIQHYTLSADAFYIPFEVTRFENKAAFVRAQLEPFFERLIAIEGRETEEDARNGGWGVLMHRNAQENTLTRPRLRSQIHAPPNEDPPASDTTFRLWGTGQLSPARAQDLLARFRQIFVELHSIEEEGPGARYFLFQLTLVPLEDRAE
jgi:hypothetical protein